MNAVYKILFHDTQDLGWGTYRTIGYVATEEDARKIVHQKNLEQFLRGGLGFGDYTYEEIELLTVDQLVK